MRPIALHGHSRAITKVKFNHDGDLLFSCAKDEQPHVWSAATGERLGTYEGHNGSIWDMDVNFTSTLVATAGADACVKIWDCLTGECLTTIPHPTPVRAVAFSHGDSMLLTVTDSSFGRKPSICCYNLPGSTPAAFRDVKTQYNPWMEYEVPEKITAAMWGPTNDTVYFGSEDGAIVILDVNDKIEQKFASDHTGEVRSLSWDKEYICLVSASTDCTARLYDGASLKCLKIYENDKPVNDACISAVLEHVLLGGGTDAQSVTNTGRNKFETRFFHKVFGDELGSISGHFGPVNAIALSPDGSMLATGGEDGFVRLHHFDSDYMNSG